ncbi:molecular chaperone TorD family protein [Breoghania sp. JC706]|uniref:TorD/DmsD family molecular chaperone n=1 Tax=Breoghania sp. JC706 TaxID=3117732 RepID=UPI00300B954A
MAERAFRAYRAAPRVEQLTAEIDLPAEEIGRAETYRLLSMLFAAPLTADLFARLERCEPDDTAIGRMLGQLGACARNVGQPGVVADYSALFIGAPAPRLMPYASYYRDGHLFGHTLADLRADLADMGVDSMPSASEPEDHLATLCEVMAGLILGHFGAPAPIADQKAFCERYLLSWTDRFFDDLDDADEAKRFFAAVGGLGRVFLRTEREAFRMLGS